MGAQGRPTTGFKHNEGFSRIGSSPTPLLLWRTGCPGGLPSKKYQRQCFDTEKKNKHIYIYIGETIQHELKCATIGFMFITIIRHIKSLIHKESLTLVNLLFK